MPVTRRDFLRSGAILGSSGLSAFAQTHHSELPKPDRPMLVLASLQPFVDPLPLPKVLEPYTHRAPEGSATKVPVYRVSMKEIRSSFHRDLPPARLWTYGEAFPGPTIEARSEQGLIVEWLNRLPAQHFLPIDHTIHGAERSLPESRTVVHVHGARVPPESDGYPEAWVAPGRRHTNFYPNRQDATALWYHDHAMGITRLNMYAGLMGFYLIRDAVEDSLRLPSGKCEIPLVLCDRMLDRDGQLYYPVAPPPASPWVGEVFGDALLVNGKLLPFFSADARRYRFRILNASNGRFFNLSMENGPRLWQIGSDQGLLPSPVALDVLALAPGERADVVIDFASHAGKAILFHNDAAPLMQIRVGASAVHDPSQLPATLRPVERLIEASAVQTRNMTFSEVTNDIGEVQMVLLNGKHWHDPVTENPTLGTVEIWDLINPTEDTHPIHLHLVRFQVLDRRSFDVFAFQDKGELRFDGPAVPPEPGEAGWKDTVRAYPGMVTRIIIRFEGFPGRYVWHCHILEHEDNDMMRPYDLLPAGSVAVKA